MEASTIPHTPMTTPRVTSEIAPAEADNQAALEERDRQGYARYPEDLDEILMWEQEAVWPDEDQ